MTSTSSTPGGTTGMPKGVMWRHEDVFFGALGGAGGGGKPITTPEEIAERCTEPRTRCVPACPFMHGTAHWMAFSTLYTGGAVVIPAEHHLDALALWQLVERDQANFMVIVGDAFARPMLDALEQRRRPRARRVAAARAAVGRRDPLALAEARARRPPARRARRRRLRRVRNRRPGPVGRGDGRRHPDLTAVPRLGRHARARRGSPTRARGGDRPAGPPGPDPARLLQGSREVRRDLSRDRRRALGGAGRPRGVRRRRSHHAARPRFGVDQHRRREGLPRRGRVGAEGPRRSHRRGRRRPPRSALG